MRYILFVVFVSMFVVSCGLTQPNPETGKSPVSEGVSVVARKVQEDPSPYGLLEALIAGAAAVGAGYVAKKKYDERQRKKAAATTTGADTLANPNAP